MPSSQACTIEHLAEVFGRCQEEIIAEWRSQAGELLRERHLDKLAITNNLPFLIAAIIRDLAISSGGAVPAEAASNDPPHHGVMRFREGLDVGEVVTEYNLLRTDFSTLANRQGLSIGDEAARIINHGIDEAVREAVMAFAEQQAVMRKEQEDDHLAFIAHDLRTPLNAVSLLVDELKEGMDQSACADASELFEILRRNLARVETLIKRALEVKKKPLVPGGQLHPECRAFELWPLVQRLLLDLRSVSSKAAIEVVNEVPPALTVFADAGLIEQVFQNLLGNAFKYAPHGRVVVRAREEGGTVTCAICDDGEGIPAQMLAKVFGKRVTDPAKDGTGFGLVIVKQIVEAHGRMVKAESTPGNGAAFRFTLLTPPESHREPLSAPGVLVPDISGTPDSTNVLG